MENKKTLKIGRSDFGLIVKNGHYFVDKTMLIYDFYNNANDIVLFPRPKRFGKTLNLSMVEHFFDIQKSDNIELFSEFEVAKKQEFCNKHQNQYWVNSGDYSLIKSRIIEIGVNEKIQNLIEGETIEKELQDNFVFQDFETDNELLWTLLTDNGYLTLSGKGDFGSYKLKIPNNEVKIVFTNIIKTWINTEVKLTRDLLTQTAKSLISNNMLDFEKGFRQITGDTLSYFDTSEKTDKKNNEKTITQEQIYHVYTLALLAILADDYIIKSNRESGEGRYDIALIPYNKDKNGIVIEFKSIETQKKKEKNEEFRNRINEEIAGAIEQIERKKYYKELIDSKLALDRIVKIPIVFVGKEPYINKITDKGVNLWKK